MSAVDAAERAALLEPVADFPEREIAPRVADYDRDHAAEGLRRLLQQVPRHLFAPKGSALQ